MSDRWIMMSDGTPQMSYIGQTDMTDELLDDYISRRKPITLTNCRAMRLILAPNPQGQGIMQSNILTSHSIARGGVTMKILPTSYWWPEQDPHAMKVLKQQLESAERSELEMRAKEKGLVTDHGQVESELRRQMAMREGLHRR